MNWQDDLQFYFFHFMPYHPFPEDHQKYASTWVDFPNRLFDPEIGHKLYQTYLKELVMADQFGYDGLVVNEHHNTAYSLMPACSLIAAALIPQTKNAKICLFGTPATLQYPNRLAEEYAMLDVMSGGRIEIAFPMGTGMEYWSNATSINPTTSRARLQEGIEVMMQAWTQPGPTSFDGEFNSYKYLNPWPLPYQKPHPKIAMVGSSPETLQYAAERGWAYSMVVAAPRKAQIEGYRRYTEVAEQAGHEVTPDKKPISAFVYVAETEEIAVREAKPHLQFFFENSIRTTPRYLAPPGYANLAAFKAGAGGAKSLHSGFNWEGLKENVRLAYGSPQQVAEKLYGWCDEVGSSRVILHMHKGDMPHWKTVKSLTMFAEEVMPLLRKKRQAETPEQRIAV
jgi:alkanesulfonate monooxygenase SsuD/methylene tetrahydromethanopterin reductase-like flavin-dependent oxidoreductase (luciferase family)